MVFLTHEDANGKIYGASEALLFVNSASTDYSESNFSNAALLNTVLDGENNSEDPPEGFKRQLCEYLINLD